MTGSAITTWLCAVSLVYPHCALRVNDKLNSVAAESLKVLWVFVEHFSRRDAAEAVALIASVDRRCSMTTSGKLVGVPLDAIQSEFAQQTNLADG
jgi:hypothetical protein